jgi:hypothetical protein
VLLLIAAILIAIFILEADLHPTERPIFMVVIPAVSLRPIIVGTRSPVSTYRAVVSVHIASFPWPGLVLTHIAIVLIALLRSPVATDLYVTPALAVLLASLVRLLGGTVWLHRSSLGDAGRRRVLGIFGE